MPEARQPHHAHEDYGYEERVRLAIEDKTNSVYTSFKEAAKAWKVSDT
jgi:hypothetical protein